MTTFKITANAIEMGLYEASSADEAILAYVRDAGYETPAEAAAALDLTVEAFLAQLNVTEA